MPLSNDTPCSQGAASILGPGSKLVLFKGILMSKQEYNNVRTISDDDVFDEKLSLHGQVGTYIQEK